MEKTQRWPIDYEALKKGDLIPAARLEEITGVKRTSPKYALAVLAVKMEIERSMDDLGKTVTLSCVGGDLKVLTDAEASTYNHRHLHQHRRGMLRSHYRNMAVDVTALTEKQKGEHEQRIETDGKYIQAIKDVPRIRIGTHRRELPGLPQSTASPA